MVIVEEAIAVNPKIIAKEIKNVMLFLQDHGVSTAFAAKIYRQYGNESIQKVKENPFRHKPFASSSTQPCLRQQTRLLLFPTSLYAVQLLSSQTKWHHALLQPKPPSYQAERKAHYAISLS